MLYFPQLTSGALGQYPVSKTVSQRAITNTLSDGHAVRYADPGAGVVQWELQYQGLADSEVTSLSEFFAACEGQLHAFTFADPLGNLLLWSEDLTQTEWQVDASLELTTGLADPNGGASATELTNPTGEDLTVKQTIASPGWYNYAFSVYVQGQPGKSVSLLRKAGGITSANAYPAGSTWQRITLSGQTDTTGESVAAGITIPAGQSARVFGFQLEPQPAASPYKPSYETNGIYTNAHFASDTFAVTTSGPNRNQCTLSIMAH